jgi:outer membrane protein OmpA-like peptidoglycan-associated protein
MTYDVGVRSFIVFVLLLLGQSSDFKHPAPLGPGVNRGNVDNFGGPHYYYAVVGPGHFDVKMAFKEMGLFGNPIRQGLTFDFKNEKGEMVSHNAIVSQGTLERSSTTGDLTVPLKVILEISADKAPVRKGGYYEVEITGAVHFDAQGAAGAGAKPIDTSLTHQVGQLSGSGVELTKPGVALTGAAEVRLTLPVNVLFASGSAVVREQARAELHRVAEAIRKQPHTRVRIEGHTDANIRMSEQRATAVRAWMVEQEHLPAGGLTVRGFGDETGTRRIDFLLMNP